ncbi:MAG: hypothetical protein LC114_15330, partial [Bryobacterales bacterium]|nr:hypothetical protein [Bryobacterales bacterium]
WVPGGLRVYVLGPPMDRQALIQGRAPRSEGFPGVAVDGARAAWMAAVLGAEPGEGRAMALEGELELSDRLRPFDAARALPEEDVFREIERKDPPKVALDAAKSSAEAWTSKMALFAEYAAEDWRRVDSDWLQSAASLALQLDRSINNTSLVLAFELVASGKVLLFVGDAELESWKSWQELSFEIPQTGGAAHKVTVGELLERTVFYKVGHHGSGNATLRSAFELMTSAELVAAIPTDEIFAREKKGWEMPSASLLEALQSSSKGRILNATPSIEAVSKSGGGSISPTNWKRFTDAVSSGAPNDLFVDFYVRL